jgi:patatin-related protein
MRDVLPNNEYQDEHRLAVVMYGGVSLSIYIGGVANELLSVVRATASARGGPGAGVPNSELKGAESVYRRIAQTPRGSTAFPQELTAADIVRNVTIDVVSGTSAGGINGIFLAKALANSQKLDPILDLWVEEGDLAKLLNDAESVKGTRLAPQDPPVALLNGRRMYEKLVAAFDSMDEERDSPAFEAGRVDLFVPTTDIRGEVIKLQVSNAMAREKRHRQRFHFKYDPSSGRNEFHRDQNLVLAYSARCTSSFPFAFEPFTWRDAAAIAAPGDARANSNDWKSRLMYLGEEYEDRPMGDGGYLDNKPFSYAIDELARRQSHLDVERTLFYVEPDPAKLEAESDQLLQSEKPDAIENAMAALISIPGYETIREDLERVIGRNERVKNLTYLEAAVEQAVQSIPAMANRATATLGDLIRHYGVSYAAYHRVKLDALIASLAELMCTSSGIGRPELAQVIRDLVELWISFEYVTPEEENQLLLDADIDHRLRKFAFVLRKMAASTDPAVVKARETLRNMYDSFYDVKRDMRRDVGAVMAGLRQGRALAEDRLMKIATLHGKERENALNELLRDTLQELAADDDHDLKKYLAEVLRPKVIDRSDTANAAVIACGASDTADARQLKAYYDGFEMFDIAIFPIVRHDGVDEAVPVNIVRISPFDAKVKLKLAGNALGHFAAFLEDDWRRSDIAAGRFNASEAIIRQLVPDRAAADVLVEQAHAAIARELLPELQQRVAASKTKRIGSSAITPAQQRQLDRALGSVINETELPAMFARRQVYDDGYDRAKQIRSVGRAGVIVEQILRSGAKKAGFTLPGVLRWGALGAMVMTQIAIPRSFHRTFANYWGRLLALIFAIMAVAGYVTKTDGLQSAGVRGFLVVTSIAALAFLLSRWIGERTFATILRWTPLAILLLVVLLARAAGVDFTDLRNLSLQGLWDGWTELVLVGPLDAFFIGMGLGLLLMTGVLAVIEDVKSVIVNAGAWLASRPRVVAEKWRRFKQWTTGGVRALRNRFFGGATT